MTRYLLRHVSTRGEKVDLPGDAIIVSSDRRIGHEGRDYYELVTIFYLVPDLPGRDAWELCTGRKPECKIGDCATCEIVKAPKEIPEMKEPRLMDLMEEKR